MLTSEFYAYGKNRRSLEAVMRIQSVKRWHMIDTTRIQTLAEHTANVSLLVMLIAQTAPIEYFNTAEAVMGALVHDISEAFTGDIPTHSKRHLTGINELEGAVTPSVFDCPLKPNDKLLIKLCDLADGIRFIRLHGVDMTAPHAMTGLERQLVVKSEEAERILNWPVHVLDHVHNHVRFYAYEKA